MDDLTTLSEALTPACVDADKFYVRCDPPITDFTTPYAGTILITTKTDEVVICPTEKTLPALAGMLDALVFADGKVVLAWDAKELMTYLSYRLKGRYKPQPAAQVYDLKVIDRFLGRKSPAPATYASAVAAVRPLAENPKLARLHKQVHVPLATRTIPRVESVGILDTGAQRRRFSSYEIEGQTHGRLRCEEAFPGCLNPHTMDDEKKKKLIAGEGRKFVLLDFHNMEVAVLRWLSQDPALGAILDRADDVYAGMFEAVMGSACRTPKHRKFIKDTFIAIIYGCQAKGLAESQGIAEDQAANLITRIYRTFPVAMRWLEDAQEAVRHSPEYADHFGRVRSYPKPWKVRNGVVAGPAAVVCMEKLIALVDRADGLFDVAASIHDGYLLVADEKNTAAAAAVGREVLQLPSGLCEGLHLRVSCMTGDNLAEMTEYAF